MIRLPSPRRAPRLFPPLAPRRAHPRPATPRPPPQIGIGKKPKKKKPPPPKPKEESPPKEEAQAE